MTAKLERALGLLAFTLTAAVLLVAPWIFGAWERWGFWPFAVTLFAAAASLGGACMLRALRPAPADGTAPRPLLSRQNLCLLLGFAPFLAYAYIRFRLTPVYLDAERHFLLHATAVLVALLVLASAGGAARRVLLLLIILDLLALGGYGIVNHLVDGSRHVLWRPGYAGYVNASRATGSYFCPDHFSGIMEIATCIGIALLLRAGTGALRLTGVLMVTMGVAGVVMSKSRGGGLTLLVVAVATLAWGLTHVPHVARNWWRFTAAILMIGLIALSTQVAGAYFERLGSYVGARNLRGKPWRVAVAEAYDVLLQQDRPMMAAAAVRAWRDAPWFGIGPGMHQHLWPHYGPDVDGDRATHRWPTRTNQAHVSNAVHHDWLQLLEEFGAVGAVLFLVPLVRAIAALRRRVLAGTPSAARGWYDTPGSLDAVMPLAAWLAAVAMAFHSIGDFNLQMPATNWLFAALMALPFGTPTPSRAADECAP